jgi:hypothetical protein
MPPHHFMEEKHVTPATHRIGRLSLLLSLAVVAGACSSAAATSTPAGSTASAAATSSSAVAGASAAASPSAAGTSAAARYTTNLKGICPDNVIVQTGWYPEADHGFAYQLIGPGGKVDTKKLTYSGPLGSTGVNLEIRAGGPAIGYQTVSSILYQDPSILFGFVGSEEQIGLTKTNPTTQVFADYETSPQAYIWGNQSWDFKTISDIGKSGQTVLGFEGSTYISVFEGKGLLDPKHVDTSWKGDPARFVAANGDIIQQAFVTNEPYAYEHDVKAWGKPVKYILTAPEFPVYEQALSVRSDKLAANSACLKAIIPLFQQATKDYLADPAATNGALLDYSNQVKTSFVLTADGLAYAAKTIKDLKLSDNGTDGVLGSFDTARVQGLIDLIGPVFTKAGKPLKDGLKPSDLVDNEFLDKNIHL